MRGRADLGSKHNLTGLPPLPRWGSHVTWASFPDKVHWLCLVFHLRLCFSHCICYWDLAVAQVLCGKCKHLGLHSFLGYKLVYPYSGVNVNSLHFVDSGWREALFPISATKANMFWSSKLFPCLGWMQLGSVRGSVIACLQLVTAIDVVRRYTKSSSAVVHVIRLTCNWENSGVLFPK